MVIGDQSRIANVAGVTFPNLDILCAFSEDDEIETKREPQSDNDPKPNS